MSINKEIEDIESDLSELVSLQAMAKRQYVKTLFSTEVQRLSQRKSDLLKELTESKVQTISDQKTTQTPAKQVLGTVIVTNYMWDQNNDFVKIYIKMDDNYCLEDSDIELSFGNKRSFVIIFGKYKFSINKLNDDINEDKSYYKVTKARKQLIIYLKKVSQKHWNTINEVENSYKKALEEEKDDLTGDPSAGLMKLMKQMYDEGDDDMKRTIAKSWYESRQKGATDITQLDSNMSI